MFDKRCMDKSMDMGMNMPYDMGNMHMGCEQPLQLDGITCPVVYECPVERVCHREICHHVPQE